MVNAAASRGVGAGGAEKEQNHGGIRSKLSAGETFGLSAS